MRIVVLAEADPTERRVALTPAAAERLISAGNTVFVASGAGASAGFADADYEAVGVSVGKAVDAMRDGGMILTVGGTALAGEVRAALGPSHTLVGLFDPLWRPDPIAELATTGTTVLALELMPRTTRAQTMDVLSSTATVTGTEAVILAARTLPKLFPLMMTAAGTIPAAKVLVLGAGVAGLAAIATAKRLGAIVSGYDVRPAAAEQIRSLGARSIELEATSGAGEDADGYAAEQTTEDVDRQRGQLAEHVASADVVITTAAIPGAASPLLVSAEMVEAMRPGSVVVDLAAERGGNCEVTAADAVIDHHGVIVLGPTDLASSAAQTASMLFANNVVSYLDHLGAADGGDLRLDRDDDIIAATLVATGGDVVHPRVKERLS